MSETQLTLDDILKEFREINATQAQEIAVLRATIAKLQAVLSNTKDKVE